MFFLSVCYHFSLLVDPMFQLLLLLIVLFLIFSHYLFVCVCRFIFLMKVSWKIFQDPKFSKFLESYEKERKLFRTKEAVSYFT